MNSKRKVIENSFFYTFSSLLVKTFGFFLIPVYTFYISPEQYGVVNLVNSFTSVAVFIVAFSLYSAVIRFYIEYKDNNEKLKILFGTIITFVSLSGVIFFALGYLFREQLIRWFFEGISFFPYILIALSSLVFISLHTIHQNILTAMQKGKKLVIINLIVFILQVLLNLFFLIIVRYQALGILLSAIIINILYFIYMLYDLFKNNLIKVTLNLKILKELLKYSIPIMPHNLSTSVASFASKVFINNNESTSEVGLYGIASQFGQIIDLVQISVNKAFQPWLFDNLQYKSIDNAKVKDFSYILILGYSIIYLLIGLFSHEAVLLMTTDGYSKAWTVIPILVIGFSVKSIYYFYINILFYYKSAARMIFISTIVGSLFDIVLAYFLVPIYGMYGSAIAFVLAKIIIVTIVILISKKYNTIGYSVIKMLKIIIPSLFFMLIGLYFSYTKYLYEISLTNLMYKTLVLLVYIVLIFIIFRKKIINFISVIKNRKKDI